MMNDDRRRRFLKGAAARGRDFNIPGRLLKKAVQQARGERRVESYFVPYIEPLSDARTKLAVLFQQPTYGEEPTTGHSTAQATVQWPTRFWS